MGPRHLSRGISVNQQGGQHEITSFNGATASEPWNQPSAKWPLALVFWRRLRAPRLVVHIVPCFLIMHLLCVAVIVHLRKFALVAHRECCQGVARHCSARAARQPASHHTSATFFPLRLDAHRIDPFHRMVFRRAQVDDEDLIFALIDDLRQGGLHAHEVDIRQIALKHGELQMRAEAFHRLKHAPQPFGIADVVGDQVVTTHPFTVS